MAHTLIRAIKEQSEQREVDDLRGKVGETVQKAVHLPYLWLNYIQSQVPPGMTLEHS